jgi:flagellar hook-associated protein 2
MTLTLSQLLSGTSSNSGNSTTSADVLAKVTKTMESRNTVAPKLNAALTSDNTKLSGLGKLLNSLTTFQSGAQSFAKAAVPLKDKVTDLIAKYNTLNASLKSLRQGELKTDGALSSIRNQFAAIMGSTSGALTRMGIIAQADGSFAVDAKKLQSAIDANPDDVAKLFSDGGKGIADKLASQIQSMVSSTGSIAKEQTALNKDIAALNAKKSALQKNMMAQAEALAKFYSSQGGSSSAGGTGSSNMPNLFGMLSS